MEFRSQTLENGLEVLAECNDEAHSCAVGFFVKTGSRDEWPQVAGVSHFLEHMVFKGTPTRTADDVNREFDAMGAEYNAFTSKESTVYWAALLPEFLDKSIELLADVLRPSLRQEDFDMEKLVIVEEIRMYEDQPPFSADERCEALHFGAHPLANSVLGTVQSVEELTSEEMRRYFEQRYSPSNIVLVAAGKVDFERMVQSASRYCGAWTPYPVNRELGDGQRHDAFECIHKSAATQQYIMQLARAPRGESEQRYAADLLTTMLGDSSGSRLYWELLDTGLAEQAGLYYVDYQGAGIFWTTLSCAPELAEQNLQALLDIYRQAETGGFTDEELQQARNKTKSRLVLGSERPRSRLFNVGGNWLQHHQYRSVAEESAAFDAVTLDEVHRVLQEYPLSKSTTVVVGPLPDVKRPA